MFLVHPVYFQFHRNTFEFSLNTHTIHSHPPKHLQHPREATVKFRINTLNVIQCDGFVQQHFVKRSGEATIYIMTMEHCDANDTPHKVKVRQMLLLQPTQIHITTSLQ